VSPKEQVKDISLKMTSLLRSERWDPSFRFARTQLGRPFGPISRQSQIRTLTLKMRHGSHLDLQFTQVVVKINTAIISSFREVELEEYFAPNGADGAPLKPSVLSYYQRLAKCLMEEA
jgi:hypothetical protein